MANTTIAELRGVGEDYINISNTFLLAIEFIDFFKLGGLGACSPRKNFNFSVSETVSGGF